MENQELKNNLKKRLKTLLEERNALDNLMINKPKFTDMESVRNEMELVYKKIEATYKELSFIMIDEWLSKEAPQSH